MDGFIFSLICVVVIALLVPVAIRAADRALDRLFSYDDAYLGAIEKAQRELDRNKHINK